MNTFEFEIAIQSKSGDNCWPIVIRCKQPDGLTIHAKGTLRLTQDDFENLIEESENEKAYGTLLGKALFREEVRDTFIRAFSKSSQDNRLRILLAIEASQKDQVKTLHWERLCAPIDADGGWNLLARDRRVPFSLYIPTIIDRCFSPIGRRDLRALILVASPSNLETYKLASFDVETALSGVKEALGEIPYNFLANNVEGALGPPTLQELSKQLTNAPKPYTLLHFVCHGKLIDTGETVLYWATPDDQVLPITAKELLEELRHVGNQKNLPHFTFLCTCESAIPRAEEALGGLAQRLVRDLGMPAVVAMTRKVSVKTALAIGQSFYGRLRESGEVDVALQEATAGLGDRYDITVPALFSRLGGRPLFSDRLEDRELTDEEIGYGIGKLRKLIAERAPHASVLKQRFKTHAEKLNNVRGADSQAARNERRQALEELDNICDQVLDLSFDALAALGKEPPEYKAECPFPGLYSFGDKKYHKFFFGRDELIKELQEELEKDNFLAVIGPSGSGKSSVVLAGLIPKLKEQNPSLQWAYLTPGREPVKQLERRLERLSKVSEQQSVLLVDQFEELFTLCENKDNRQEFITSLLTFASRRKVVMTMRADFLGECTFYPELSKRIEARPKLVGTMKPAELITVMKMQADKAGLRFETGLSNSILNEVQEEPGAMPLLQYALQELWKRRHGRWLCDEEYQAIGRVQQAIAKTADDFYNSLPASEQKLVQNIFFRLTRLDESAVQGDKRRDTRRRVELEDLVPEGGDLAVTKKLVQQLAGEEARLVVTSRNDTTGKEEVEVAHEALIRHWSMLQNWLDQNRSNLQLRETISQAAEDWKKHKDQPDKDTYLIHQGGRLQDAEELLKQPRFVHLNPQETEYVKACVELRDRQRKQKEQRRQLLIIGAVSIAFILGVFASVAGYQWRKAEIQQIQAYLESAETGIITHQALDARIGSLRAWKVFKQSFWQDLWPDDELRNQVLGKLFRTVYAGQEININRLTSDRGRVVSVAFSPEGQIATGDDSGTIHLWNNKTQKWKTLSISRPRLSFFSSLGTHVAHQDTQVAFSPDGKFLISTSADKVIRLFNNKTKTLLRSWDDEKERSISPDGQILVTIEDKALHLEDIKNKKLYKLWRERQKDAYTRVIFSPDSQLLATIGDDNTILLWDIKNKKLIKEFDKNHAPVYSDNSLAFSPNSQFLIVPGKNDTIQLRNIQDLKIVKEVPGHQGTFSPNSQLLAVAGKNNTIQLWNIKNQEIVKEIPGRQGTFSPNSQLLAVAGENNTIQLWNIKGQLLSNLQGHQGEIRNMAFSPDGQLLVTSGTDGTIRLWVVSNQWLTVIRTGFKGMGAVKLTFSPDSQRLVTTSAEGIQLWNTKGKSLPLPQEYQGQGNSAAFSPDGQLLIATTVNDNVVRLLDVEGNLRARLPGDFPAEVAISPDGQHSAFSEDIYRNGSRVSVGIRLGNSQGKKQLLKLQGNEGEDVARIVFSPNSQHLAVSGSLGILEDPSGEKSSLWLGNTRDQQLVKLQAEGADSFVFSPDSQSLVTLGEENTIQLWNNKGHLLKTILVKQQDRVSSVAFSPEGQFLITGGKDGTIILWSIKGQQLATLQGYQSQLAKLQEQSGYQGSVHGVAFSPDGQLLATSEIGDGENSIVLYQIGELDKLVAMNCDWVHDYLKNPSAELNKSDRHLCDGIE